MENFTVHLDNTDLIITAASKKLEFFQVVKAKTGCEINRAEFCEIVDRTFRKLVFPVKVELQNSSMPQEYIDKLRARLALSESHLKEKFDRYMEA